MIFEHECKLLIQEEIDLIIEISNLKEKAFFKCLRKEILAQKLVPEWIEKNNSFAVSILIKLGIIAFSKGAKYKIERKNS